jgi:hypothetical protein
MSETWLRFRFWKQNWIVARGRRTEPQRVVQFPTGSDQFCSDLLLCPIEHLGKPTPYSRLPIR